MSSYVSAALRRLVAERAGRICEYCLVHEDDTFFGCQVEHIISEKHGGPTAEENLAYACAFCNRFKGSDNCLPSVERMWAGFGAGQRGRFVFLFSCSVEPILFIVLMPRRQGLCPCNPRAVELASPAATC